MTRERPRCYIGHYMDLPGDWFLCVTRSPEAAIDFIDCEWGEPDARSLTAIDGPFAFQFRAALEAIGENDEEMVVCRPEVQEGGELSDAFYFDEDATEWMMERLRNPFGLPSRGDYRAQDAVLGRPMPDAMRGAIDKTTVNTRRLRKPGKR